jgi:hypothetical protein
MWWNNHNHELWILEHRIEERSHCLFYDRSTGRLFALWDRKSPTVNELFDSAVQTRLLSSAQKARAWHSTVSVYSKSSTINVAWTIITFFQYTSTFHSQHYNVFRAYLIDAKDTMTPWFTNSQFVCYKSNKKLYNNAQTPLARNYSKDSSLKSES